MAAPPGGVKEWIRVAAEGDLVSALSVTVDGMEVALFRIMQEALEHIVQTGSATAVDVLLTLHGDRVALVIEENGEPVVPPARDAGWSFASATPASASPPTNSRPFFRRSTRRTAPSRANTAAPVWG